MLMMGYCFGWSTSKRRNDAKAIDSSSGYISKQMDANMPYACWIGFNQVKELPEQLLMPYVATTIQVEGILHSGHYLFEEKPNRYLN